jgi:hypothetical protein
LKGQQLSHTDSVIIEAFKQSIGAGAAGNCASISVIKLAISNFGIDGIFKRIDSSANGYSVVLRNDKVITLSPQEVLAVSPYDRFDTGNNVPMLNKAKFAYAVMAKNKQMMQPDKYSDIVSAVKDDQGNLLLFEDTEKNFELIGLGNLWVKVDLAHINDFDKIIITNIKHSAYSSMGFFDQYGTIISNALFVRKHSTCFSRIFANRRITNAYRLKDTVNP